MNGLSDHCPMLIQFPSSPKPKKAFLFCEMWCKHPDFLRLVASVTPSVISSPLRQLREVMLKLKRLLSKLHKDHYADLRAQYSLAKDELTKLQHLLHDDPLNAHYIQAETQARGKYISILSSSLSLMKQ